MVWREDRKRSSAHKVHQAASLRVIADHSRAATFLISDGVLPSNEGRGYVLRKIIRRAYARTTARPDEAVPLRDGLRRRDLMQDAYPELNESADRVSKVIEGEETRFANTLNVGLEKLRRGQRSAGSRPRPGSRCRSGEAHSSSTTPSACRSTS
jgi:alanyl-tRNA synthetase